MNKNNIIVERCHSTSDGSPHYDYVISGLVDFADADTSVYVYELATVMADIMASDYEMEPLEIGREIFRGYVEEFLLNEMELSVLKLCIYIRLLQNYVLRSETLVDNPENKYIDDGWIESYADTFGN